MARRTLLGEFRDYVTDPEARRTRVLEAQDGIISTAGILLGFTGAGANEATLVLAGSAAIVAGMLTAGGAKWSELDTEREVEQRALADARRDHRAQRGVERAELVAYYQGKGLAADLAEEVADALMRRSPLKATLESEHGIVRLTSRAAVAIAGLGAAVSFGLGAAIPFLIAYFLPVRIELGVILVAVLVSLVLLSVIGARVGRLNMRRTMLRTTMVAAVTIMVSYFAGMAA